MKESLILKYRPKSFDKMIGNRSVIESFENALEQKLAHAFLFIGPSGVGKTTAARIAKERLNAELIEVDGATTTGVENMRNITNIGQFKSFGCDAKLFIIDECHMLSSAAWTILLKTIEEPPEDTYWIFCATEESKIPTNIRTRCHTLIFREVGFQNLVELLSSVCVNEEHELDKEIIEEIAYNSEGSCREALSHLSLCWGAKSIEEVNLLIKSIDKKDTQVVSMCKLIMKDSLVWEDVQDLYQQMKSLDPEIIRRQICSYLTTVLLTTKNEELQIKLLMALEQLRENCEKKEWTTLVLGLAHIVFKEDVDDVE